MPSRPTVTYAHPKEKPNIAVIMITGYASIESSIEAIRSGIADYVPKPFTPDELNDAVVRVLERAGRIPAARSGDLGGHKKKIGAI